MNRIFSACGIAAMVGALLLAVWSPNAPAQAAKPGRVIVGVPPGSNIDATARILAEEMGKAAGQQFIVENRPGAGGTIAAEAIMRSSPDGSTVFLSPISTMVTEPQVNRKNVRYDSFKDFAAVSIVATIDLALAVGPALSATTFAEYLAAVRADPDRGFFTSPGINGLPHFFGMLIGRQSGAKLTHVPFGGPAPAVQAVLGGQVPALIVGYSDLIALHRAGKFRILATSGLSRVPLTPEVPTFRELGFPLEVSVWYGLFAPAATPAETIDRLNKLAVEAARSTKMAHFLETSGHRVVGSTAQQLADTLRRDFDYWGSFIRSMGIKVD